MKIKNKRKQVRIIGFLLAALIISVSVSLFSQVLSAAESPGTGGTASSIISPALNSIRGNFELKKSALVNNEITFNAEEFERILGIKKLKHIKITKLPPVSEGVLIIGGVEVLENQTISRENIKYMRLVPYPDRTGTISLYFKNGSDEANADPILCTVSVLQTLNFAPSAYPQDISTQKNIAVFGAMDGEDPDKDNLNYKIIRTPSKGTLSVSDITNGHFAYRPNTNFTGTDSFVYQIQDEYGNLSNLATVEIKVTKAASDIVFTDMKNHWANNAAVKAVANGFIDVVSTSGGEINFNPHLPMTRVEFLEMTMRAAKLDKDMQDIFDTGFADDSDIALKYKPYVKKARDLGIVQGIATETGVYFDPNSVITRSEAAVIINNILNVPLNNLSRATSKPQFVDAVAIPEWAEEDITALNASGIIKGDENGNMNPHGLMTKAQSVEMLCAMIDYTENQKKPFSLLSWIFK